MRQDLRSESLEQEINSRIHLLLSRKTLSPDPFCNEAGSVPRRGAARPVPRRTGDVNVGERLLRADEVLQEKGSVDGPAEPGVSDVLDVF